jgi:hypothetical protein
MISKPCGGNENQGQTYFQQEHRTAAAQQPPSDTAGTSHRVRMSLREREGVMCDGVRDVLRDVRL